MQLLMVIVYSNTYTVELVHFDEVEYDSIREYSASIHISQSTLTKFALIELYGLTMIKSIRYTD